MSFVLRFGLRSCLICVVLLQVFCGSRFSTAAGEEPTSAPGRWASAIVDSSALPRSADAGAGGATQAMRDALTDAGESPRTIPVDALLTEDGLDNVDLLVLPDAPRVPVAAIDSIQRFLARGGRLLAAGAPLCEAGVFRAGGRWMTRADYEQALRKIVPSHPLLRFDGPTVASLHRSSDNLAQQVTIESVETDQHAPALHVVIPRLTGWETLECQLDRPFPPGHTLTCFRARGDQDTRQLALEWREEDGSRWIATVPLTTQWQNYALSPDAFRPWQPPKGRGGAGDGLNLQNATTFSVGVAFSHTEYRRGRDEYWFAELGTAEAPFAGAAPQSQQVRHIDGLCPSYQFYRMSDVAMLKTAPGQKLITGTQVPISQADVHESAATGPATEPLAETGLLSLQPRPGGAGFDKDRPYRWQPLLEAWSADDDYRGTVAALIVPLKGTQRGSAIAVFTPTRSAFYEQPAVRKLLADTIRAMHRGVFLAEGGSNLYTGVPKQKVMLGARVIGLNDRTQAELKVRVRVVPAGGDNTAGGGYDQTSRISLRDTLVELQAVEDRFAIPPEGGRVSITLLDEHGEQIDQLEHDLYTWRPDKPQHFVRVRDGRFWLDGKPWKANGVNYMPSSGIGLPLRDNEIFEHWIGSAGYDPAIVGRDLDRIRAMNLNAVSAFIYYESLPAGNLLDFLRQCRERGLKVNLSLRPGTPIEFDWDKWKAIIQQSRLAQNDTVFAYDLAWEWTHWSRDYQVEHYTDAWQEWVQKRYGSLGAAEKTWGVAAPREDGKLAVPISSQLFEDGQWRKLAADYRLFLDQFIGEKYAAARQLVRSIDPNHLVSFRMNIAGDPTAHDPGNMAYDFWGLRDAVDFFAPEAYGRIGDWEWIKPGRFTVSYARLCNPKLPLVWAEMGYTVWDPLLMRPREDRLNFQAAFYGDFYRMMRESGSDGIFFWWFPGGYRTNEQSDFGILNPDGTDRPVTKVIREEGPRFLAAPPPPKPDVFLKIDRDRDARGLYGIYAAVKDDYWRAIAAGKTPGLKWAREPNGAR